MITRILFITALSTGRIFAADQRLIELGEFVQLVPRPTSDAQPAKDSPGFERLLDRIAISPSDGTSPKSLVVSGRVVSGNTGGPLERIPIYVGSQSEAPRLAALTNVDGEFKFRLWLKEDHREVEIQVPMDLSGFLYVDGTPTTTDYREVRLVAGFSRRYALKSLMAFVVGSQKDGAKK